MVCDWQLLGTRHLCAEHIPAAITRTCLVHLICARLFAFCTPTCSSALDMAIQFDGLGIPLKKQRVRYWIWREPNLVWRTVAFRPHWSIFIFRQTTDRYTWFAIVVWALESYNRFTVVFGQNFQGLVSAPFRVFWHGIVRERSLLKRTLMMKLFQGHHSQPQVATSLRLPAMKVSRGHPSRITILN